MKTRLHAGLGFAVLIIALLTLVACSAAPAAPTPAPAPPTAAAAAPTAAPAKATTAAAAPTAVPPTATAVPLNFPTKPVEWVVPFAAGGGTDLVSRAFAAKAEKIVKQPIRVLNQPAGEARRDRAPAPMPRRMATRSATAAQGR